MDKKSIILVITIFVLLILGMFLFAYLSKEEVVVAPVATEPIDLAPVSDPYAYIERIDGKHFFLDGEHVVVGQLTMPTPCDLVDVQAVVMESMPEQVRLDFTVINNAEMCAQVLTEQRFMVSAQASEVANLSATFMGREVALNLVPALPGESPADYELFIKG